MRQFCVETVLDGNIAESAWGAEMTYNSSRRARESGGSGLTRPQRSVLRAETDTSSGEQADSAQVATGRPDTADVDSATHAGLLYDDEESQNREAHSPASRREDIARGKQRAVDENLSGEEDTLQSLLKKAEQSRQEADRARASFWSRVVPSGFTSARPPVRVRRSCTVRATFEGEGSSASAAPDPDADRMREEVDDPDPDSMHEEVENLLRDARKVQVASARHAQSETGRELSRAMDQLGRFWRYDRHAQAANAHLAEDVREASVRHQEYVKILEEPKDELIKNAQSLAVTRESKGPRDVLDNLKESLDKLHRLEGAHPSDDRLISVLDELRETAGVLALLKQEPEPNPRADIEFGRNSETDRVWPTVQLQEPGSLSWSTGLPEDPYNLSKEYWDTGLLGRKYTF